MDSHHRPSGYEPAILLLNYPAIIQEGILTSAQAGLPCRTQRSISAPGASSSLVNGVTTALTITVLLT